MDADRVRDFKRYRVAALRNQLRREGSLAAALTQSMALAVIGTAGAYPSWVLVKGEKEDIVLGATWAVTQLDPEPDSPLLGTSGGPVMFAIASCCLLSAATGSLALMLDFLGRRQGRSSAPLLHGVTAVLIASSAACGSCLLALVRGRVRTEPTLTPLNYTINPGQSLFLSFLACVLAATATGLSCSSPARVQPARSSWDLGRPMRRPFRPPVETGTPSMESVVWQEGRLPSFLVDVEDEARKPRWYDDYSSHSFLRSMLHPSSHAGLESLTEISSLDRSWGGMGSTLSIESSVPLKAPAPSRMDWQSSSEETEELPFSQTESEPEVQPLGQAQSLTWREAAIREANAGD